MANELATNPTFEFEPLRQAINYRLALVKEYSGYLQGKVLEAGSGIGMMTELLVRMPAVTGVTAVEPDQSFCEKLRQSFPALTVLQGTLEDLNETDDWNALLSVNVLEHIEDDERELRICHNLLKRATGALCLFVPARPEIYAPLDRDFGHFRRYAKLELRQKLERSGFSIVKLHYFNLIGYLGWWWNFCFLKKRCFEAGLVKSFDRHIFPVGFAFESRVMRPPFGQSLIAVARAT